MKSLIFIISLIYINSAYSQDYSSIKIEHYSEYIRLSNAYIKAVDEEDHKFIASYIPSIYTFRHEKKDPVLLEKHIGDFAKILSRIPFKLKNEKAEFVCGFSIGNNAFIMENREWSSLNNKSMPHFLEETMFFKIKNDWYVGDNTKTTYSSFPDIFPFKNIIDEKCVSKMALK